MITLINDDFREVFPHIGPVRMIFADPPDNINLGYGEYSDRLSECAYSSLLQSILDLGTDSADIVWISYNAAHTYLMAHLIYHFLENNSDWEAKPCVQVFTFGQHNQRDLGNNHRPLARLMRKGTSLYPDAVRVPSWRQLHGDKRADPRGKVPGDVMHAEQYTRYTLPLPNMSVEDIQRMLSKVCVTNSDDCWEWRGGKRDGYGRIRIGGHRGNLYNVTRLMWRLVHGTDPIGQLVLHTCDNPSCCNPSHLFLGTDADNSNDKVVKGRQHAPKGVLNGQSTLTEADVINIYHTHGTYTSIAKEYGVSSVTISNIKTGKTWSHLTAKEGLSDVFDFPRVTGNSKQRRKYHPTQLNELLYERCIRLSCKPTDTVCDIFAGTGTMARVCAETGNPCILIDVDAEYCKKIAEEHGLALVSKQEWRSE